MSSSRTTVLDSLCESVERRDEGIGTLAKLAVGGALAAKILGPGKSKRTTGKQTINVLSMAQSLVRAKNQKQEVAAVVGLIGIAARVLLRVPDLRDLGFKLQKIVDDDRLEEYVK